LKALPSWLDGQAVARRQQRDLVVGHLVGQGKGDAGGLGVEQGVGLALEALVALHALVGGVAGFALFKGQLDAVDAAVAGVDHLDVVLLAVGPGRAVGRVGAGAVDQQREELLLGLRRGDRGQQGAGQASSGHRSGQNELTKLHGLSPRVGC